MSAPADRTNAPGRTDREARAEAEYGAAGPRAWGPWYWPRGLAFLGLYRLVCLRAAHGVLRQVYRRAPHSRILWTNEESADGPLTTLTFEEQDGKTLLALHELYPSREDELLVTLVPP